MTQNYFNRKLLGKSAELVENFNTMSNEGSSFWTGK